MDKKWYQLINKMEDFMYGDKGIYTIALADENLKTYLLDTEKIIDIIKELKEFEKDGFNEKQKRYLEELKKDFLKIDNGNNNIKLKYHEIIKIYDNLEEYKS